MKPLGRTPPVVSYDIKPILRPLAGRGYLGFTCASCGAEVAMLNDAGSGKRAGLPPARFEVQCPTCRETASYSTADLKPFQA